MKGFLYIFGISLVAFSILFISLLRLASLDYSFNKSSARISPDGLNGFLVLLPYPGTILPGEILWPVVAAKDWLETFLIKDKVQKTERLLFLADKRLSSALRLFEKEKYEDGVSALVKAEKYLELAVNEEEKAREGGEETRQILLKLNKSAIKHKEIIEYFLDQLPEDARPIVILALDYPKKLSKRTEESLTKMGIIPINYDNFEEEN